MATLETPADRVLGERCCVKPGARRLRPAQAARLAEDLRLLSDPVRLQILDILAGSPGTVCVCDLEASLPVQQPTISHHLSLLRKAGLVHVHRKGLWAHYSIHRPALEAWRLRAAAFLETL
jgi:ArsR family transcriptional regulator